MGTGSSEAAARKGMNRIDDYRSQKERDAEMQRYMDSRPYGKQRDKIVRIIEALEQCVRVAVGAFWIGFTLWVLKLILSGHA